MFVTGRPVVFIPAVGSFKTLGRHVLIAWNSSRASTRAVNDALSVIERADKVTVLAVNPEEFAKRYGALPPERMVENLRRHGAAVQGVWLNDIPTGSIAWTTPGLRQWQSHATLVSRPISFSPLSLAGSCKKLAGIE